MTGNTSRARRELDGAAFPHVQDSRLLLLLNHWLERRGSDAVPLRSAIDPAAIAPALPSIWLCEFLPDEGRFRMRLAGEEINRLYGRNVSRSYFEEIANERFLATVVRRYRRIIEEPAIMHCGGHIYFANDSRVVGERLGLPLRTEDGLISQIIGVSVYDIPHEQVDFEIRNEAMKENFTPLFD
jgi:hypothetical protein